jgi:hypothetical protein
MFSPLLTRFHHHRREKARPPTNPTVVFFPLPFQEKAEIKQTRNSMHMHELGNPGPRLPEAPLLLPAVPIPPLVFNIHGHEGQSFRLSESAIANRSR